MITKLLIANRGEIARRIMRTCRAVGVRTVAVFSDADADAPHVVDADEAVHIGPSAPSESYLRIDAVVDAAARVDADALHPGYGFLAENAELARACVEAGITFVGPTAAAIEAMGSKLEAKRLMTEAGVPVLDGVDLSGLDENEIAEAAARIGYPVLVKASAGGGGKGMNVVEDDTRLKRAVDSARRTAASAFGDDTVFLERYLTAPRHVEIQIFGDTHGEVVHLFERECSIQRRHQKILEESPSVAVDDELRATMGEAAVAAGRAIGYQSAGTVEFVLDQDGRFYFLEVNTRLQVEHPVTEAITGLDLVAAQLAVADGLPLPDALRSASIDGHAIEVRLYSEDASRKFLPVSGTVHRFRPPADTTVRFDSGIRDGSEVSVFYDPMLAKVIAHAPTRAEAARALADALDRTQVHGLVTNREFLIGLLRNEDFLAGDTDTHFLDRHLPADLAAAARPADPDGRIGRLHALAAALSLQASNRTDAVVARPAPSGFRNNPSQNRLVTFEDGDVEVAVGYRLTRGELNSEIDGVEMTGVAVRSATPDEVVLVVDGVQRAWSVNRVDDTFYLDSPLGHRTLFRQSRFPASSDAARAGSLVAPLPGKVLRVAVEVGDKVGEGDLLVLVEAMKMEHQITAPGPGVVDPRACRRGRPGRQRRSARRAERDLTSSTTGASTGSSATLPPAQGHQGGERHRGLPPHPGRRARPTRRAQAGHGRTTPRVLPALPRGGRRLCVLGRRAGVRRLWPQRAPPADRGLSRPPITPGCSASSSATTRSACG